MKTSLILSYSILLSFISRSWAVRFLQSDYVIVGGGTAGCSLAARLCTLLPEASITLLERSQPRDEEAEFLVRSPRKVFEAFSSPKLTEIFQDVPSPGLGNRSSGVGTGNTLGGSSSINGMQWVVPVRETVEKWGIKGLTTTSSLKFYERAFMKVVFKAQSPNIEFKYTQDQLRAAVSAGYPEINDPFDIQVRKSSYANLVAVDAAGFRRDSCTSYLDPALKGPCKHNLQLIQSATVTQVLFRRRRSKQLIAKGVEYVNTSDKKLKHKLKISTRKEVILSAGPIGSPKLLQLSGIGPRAVLRKSGIHSKLTLPVGARTQARIAVLITSAYAVELAPSNNSTLLDSQVSRKQWESGKGGVLASSTLNLNGRDRLDSYLFGSGNVFPESVDQPIINTGCSVNPSSYGYLRIKDANPFTSPNVQFAFLSKEEDIERAERCANRIIKIHKRFPPRFNLTFVNPPDGVVTRPWIRKNALWPGHFVGGCAVGLVLRPDLRVRQVKGLRVVDASSLSSIPTSAGPMASVYMLAEYSAELIATDYKTALNYKF